MMSPWVCIGISYPAHFGYFMFIPASVIYFFHKRGVIIDTHLWPRMEIKIRNQPVIADPLAVSKMVGARFRVSRVDYDLIKILPIVYFIRFFDAPKGGRIATLVTTEIPETKFAVYL